MQFVGRQAELETLAQALRGSRSAMIPVYGRRRVGKTELILRALRTAHAVYYVGKNAPAELQLREFMRQAARALAQPWIADVSVDGWQRALELVSEHAPSNEKLVLALDEFQWMAQVSPELPSVLQELWDRRWKRTGRVVLILCGSFVGFMEREVLGKKSPLFGRRTAQIHLKPLSYVEAAEFHPRWSLADRARAYFICGGVPFYLEMFDPARSIEQNVEVAVMGEHSPLSREPDFLLREELREVESYYAVLMALATGIVQHGEIARRTGIRERSLGYYLMQLIDLGYVERRYPLTATRPSQRSVRYSLSDPLLRFWFRFLFPNQTFLQQEGPSRTYRDLVRPELDAYFGRCFEGLCREALPRIYQKEQVRAAYRVGEYWADDVQIDVVGQREDGLIDLGECKWGAFGGKAKLTAELEGKVGRYPNRENKTIRLHAFVRKRPRGVTTDRAVHWHDLDDLYAKL